MPLPAFLLPLIMAGAGAGSSVIGGKMASNQMGRGNEIARDEFEWKKRMADQETQRRNALQQMFLPMILQGMGVKSPQLLGQMRYPQVGQLYGQGIQRPYQYTNDLNENY